VTTVLSELCQRAAVRHVRAEEAVRREAARAAEQVEKAAAAAAKRAAAEERARRIEAEKEEARVKRQQEKEAREAERTREAALKHMRGVKAAAERRAVYVDLRVAQSEDGQFVPRLSFRFPDAPTVVATKLRDGMDRLMAEYDYRGDGVKFSKNHRWCQLMDGIVLELQTSIGEAYAVRASVGCGGWARVPWIAVAAPQQSTQHGLYLQLLFAADMSAAHLCLGQLAAGAHLAEVGRYVRRRCAELELLADGGFDLSGEIDLRAGKTGLAADYAKGSIVSLRLGAGELPPEAELHASLHALLRAYDVILADEGYLTLTQPVNEQLASSKPDGRKSMGGGAGAKRPRKSFGGDGEYEEPSYTPSGSSSRPHSKRPRVAVSALASDGGSGFDTAQGPSKRRKVHDAPPAGAAATVAAAAAAAAGTARVQPRLRQRTLLIEWAKKSSL